MKRDNRKHVVIFRLTESEWSAASLRAEAVGESLNDWARAVVVERSGESHTLTKNEMILFEELARVRFLLGNAFKLMATGALTGEAWDGVRKDAAESAEEHARLLLSRYESRWYFGAAALAMVEEDTSGA